MIAYHATLDVPRELAQFVAKLLLAERRRRGLCLTDPSGATLNGTQVKARTCQNYKDQHWTGS